MSKFSFTDPTTGRKYDVDAPSGVSRDQAEAIFKQQLDGGSLAGIDVGGVLSAATQAAGGLASAAAMLTQNLGALTNKLPIGTSLNTITSALGPGGLASASQLVSSLQGPGASIATNTIGSASGAAVAAVKEAYGTISSVTGLISQGTATAGNLASKAVTSLTGSLAGPVTDGINTADLVKQGSGTGLPDLSAVNTQAAMSQVAKLVGQPHTVVSNTLGVGKFGFDIPQLETAGLVKPGVAAAAAATGASLTSVLSSPTAFTGKDGVKSLNNLLSNESLQNNIQQNLMSSGVGDLKSLGLPVSSLNPQAIAGLATSSAKSVENTVASLQGVAGPDVKSAFDTLVRDSAYAVDYVETKVDSSALGIVTAEPAENTVNAETLNAALVRIVGNPKVFEP